MPRRTCLIASLGTLLVAIMLSGCMDTSPNETNGNGPYTFNNPKKSAHYEANTPAHGEVLAGVPINVVIDFNFDLGPGSEMSIGKDGENYGSGSTTIDDNKLAMRRKMDPNAPDGVYMVEYTACWPDGSCHEGHFEFAINRTKAMEFTDQRGEEMVEIAMSNIAFVPRLVRVSAGTEVVWTNEDAVIHYVNTDPHPHHTYFPDQNSQALNQGETFSLVFNEPGMYPYHCSAHTGMTGQILVE